MIIAIYIISGIYGIVYFLQFRSLVFIGIRSVLLGYWHPHDLGARFRTNGDKGGSKLWLERVVHDFRLLWPCLQYHDEVCLLLLLLLAVSYQGDIQCIQLYERP